ncbi:UNVERIFIED_CONTAM: hypothetical protein PYX00_006453 [Menopon gallinae]|uniref:Uncharacterized protein n=1 Tax=Menopon gallinae TaxID=328185 RepID=A0AAW2HWS3_9NEOP
MTSRPNDSPGTNCQTRSDGRSDQESSTKVEEEGCPVIEESGAVCGETRTLSIFQEFRQIYNECMRRMESNKEDNLALRKLAPFRKLVEDLWEQNVMLVETVEELEQEATSRVASLQNKLDQCSDKDTQNLLRQKDREICCLTLEITNKNDLLSKYYNQIDELRRDMKSRSKKYQEILCRLKDAAVQRLDQLPCDEMEFEDDGEHGEGDSYEAKLNKFREILLASTCHLEKTLRVMASCVVCSSCECKQMIDEEGQALEYIKKDLVSLQICKGGGEQQRPSKSKKQSDNQVTLNANEVDNFRVEAVTAVATLEEMKEQLDVLQEIIRKCCNEMPGELEKGQIEECENKYYKYHEDFDAITDNLCEMLEAVNRSRQASIRQSNDCGKVDEKANEERNRLEKEIREQEEYMNKIKEDLKELEAKLGKTRCMSEEQEKELKCRDEEITRLANGVKGFRERLKDMQLDMAWNLNCGTKAENLSGSRSNLSILSDELQELCEILTASQTSIPGFIEKWKEENFQLQNKLACLEKCLNNKDQTLGLLQQSLKLKDDQIEELTSKLEATEEELKQLKKDFEEKCRLINNLQDSMRKSKEFEETVAHLQAELRSRECEVEQLYEKVRCLEQELECELKKCEQKTHEDLKCINELSVVIRNLQNELVNAEVNAEKFQRSPRSLSEDNGKHADLKSINHQLKCENKQLRQRLRQLERHDDISSKIADLENVIKQGECRQQIYNDKINELQKILEETISIHECEKKRLGEKLCKAEHENERSKLLISKLNETIKCKNRIENNLKEAIDQQERDLENLRSENERIRMGKTNPQTGDTINDLQTQKSNLKIRCCTLKSEIDKEEKTKKALETRIIKLNDMLAKKTHQFNELTQNYKCTSARAQEAVTKLKDAEGRLKCIKLAMNKRKGCDSGEEYDGNEDHVKRCLEDSLEAKSTECTDLMCEVQALQMKLQSMQDDFISSQSHKDCEMSCLKKEIARLEGELEVAEKEKWNLKCDMKKTQDQLKNKATSEDSHKDEIDMKNKELYELICEKKSLLESMDDLHKRLEEICLDNTKKEKENKDLMDECCRLRKEVSGLEKELSGAKRELEDLREQYSDSLKKLKCSEKKMENLKKLYCRVNEENANLQDGKNITEKQLCEARAENFMLKEKMLSAKKQKEMEANKLKTEHSSAQEEKMKYCNKIKELNCKIKNFEENIIPHLEDEIMRKERCLERYKMELREANESSQRMREESLRVIQCTKKYLTAQKCANDSMKICSKDNRQYSNFSGELEEQLKSVAQMNEHLYFELQSGKSAYKDAEPRSFSPLPWGCSNVERDDSSPEFLAESGFQSMQPSPTNMHFDYCSEIKRTPSQWNSNLGRHADNKDYNPCRNSSVR